LARLKQLDYITGILGRQKRKTMNSVIFFEEQKFTQKWISAIQIVLLIGCAFLAILLVFQHQTGIILGILPFSFACLFVILFRTIRLETRFSPEEFSYRFYPFQIRYRVIPKSDIARIEVRSYDPLDEYGGWGIRYGKTGWAFTIKGNDSIDVVLHNRKELLIGTGKAKEIQKILRENQWLK
jgi:hypothetical protein